MAILRIGCLLLSIFIAVTLGNEDTVPALLWTDGKHEFPVPLAGHTTRKDEFKSDYLQHAVTKPGHTLIAFLQDKLSLEDIIENADVYNEHSTGSKFANLKRLVETHNSVHLPAVFSPGETIDELAKNLHAVTHHLHAPFDLSKVPLDRTGSNLVLVHLPHNNGKNFDEIDALINGVTEKAKSLQLPFTAVYTGYTSSQKPEVPEYTGRHLLAVEEPDFSFFNVSGCIFIYFESLKLEVKNSKNSAHFNLPARNQSDSASQCENHKNGTGKFVVTYPTVENLKSFKLVIDFTTDKAGFWLGNISISYNVENMSIAADNVYMASQDVSAISQFSYHCTTPYPIPQLTATNSSSAILRFTNLQVQFGIIKNDKFGQANDCEGFFTVPILSGLVAGQLLVFILTFGICMILNISTMDRFDDPKGKTITVNVAE